MLSDAYHIVASDLAELGSHYLDNEVFGYKEHHKIRLDMIVELLRNECELLDLNLDGMGGDPEALIKRQKLNKLIDNQFVKRQNELLEKLKIKSS